MVDLNQIKIVFFDLEDESVHGFIDQCQDIPINLCLVSLNGNSANTLKKLALAQKTYGSSFELCSAPSPELTFTVMETMAKLHGYAANEVLLVSYNAKAIKLAKEKGFLVPVDLAKDFIITEKNSEKIGFTDKTRNLVIPSVFYSEKDGVWYKTTEIGSEAFTYCSNLKSVTISDTVATIGSAAFRQCTNLESVTMPNSVTEIGNSAFAYCTSLESVEIPDSVTLIGKAAFRDCTNLKSVTIPDSVISIGNSAFAYCTNLESVVIPDSVTAVKLLAFYRCARLKSLVIGDSVTSIGNYAFEDCEFLESLTIPKSVNSIGISAFEGCTKLTIRVLNSVAEIKSSAFYDVPKVIYNGMDTGAYWGAKSIVKE